MKIVSARYSAYDNSSVAATTTDGTVLNMAYPCHTAGREELDEFLAEGGEIEPIPREKSPREKSPSAGRAKKNKAAQTRGDQCGVQEA